MYASKGYIIRRGIASCFGCLSKEDSIKDEMHNSSPDLYLYIYIYLLILQTEYLRLVKNYNNYLNRKKKIKLFYLKSLKAGP